MKIAFIGAGSLGFTTELVRDILTFDLLKDSTLALMDIDDERLEFAQASVKRIVAAGKYPAKVLATKDRKKALKDADVVLTTILSGSTGVWKHDIEIPKKYGVDINVGDTRGPSGIFRFLRTLPPMLEIVRDMEKYCPGAVLLNYTNPMAMLCGALQRSTHIPVTGLCHSVQGTAIMLACWIGARSFDDITYTCAGINHQAFYLKFENNGKDAYPHIYKAVTENPDVYNEEIVRNEMYLHLGYYPTESSGHNSEYNAWFRKRPDLIEKYCLPGKGWNPGEYAYILKEYQETEATWKDRVKKELEKPLEPQDLSRGMEYASFIINALAGGEIYSFNGNVPNTHLITNLPEDACVEVPVYVDKAGFHPVHVGALPPQLVTLVHTNCMVEEMAITAALTGDARLVMQSILNDPLTSAVLSMAEIRTMVREMFEQNRSYLGYFKKMDI
jgi:alpha-galactosidase